MVTLVGGVKFFFFKTERYIGWLCEHLTKKSLDFWQFLPQNSKKGFISHFVIKGSQWLLKGHHLTGRSVPILNRSVMFLAILVFFQSVFVRLENCLFVVDVTDLEKIFAKIRILKYFSHFWVGVDPKVISRLHRCLSCLINNELFFLFFFWGGEVMNELIPTKKLI